MNESHKVYLSLGANIGDRERTLRLAVALLESRVGHVERQSSLHDTAPWGFRSANRFLNACVLVLTGLSPRQVLEATQAIERELGRTRKSVDGQYHDRPIDIDILLYDNLRVEEPDLCIPHPHMTERDFVMKPLAEIL